MSYIVLSNIGLLIDVFGVLVLFKYGLPSDVFPNGDIPKIMDGHNEKTKFKKYKKRSYFGLSLLILGFLMQFVGNILQYYNQ